MAADPPEHGAPPRRTGFSDFWDIFSANYQKATAGQEATAGAPGAVSSREPSTELLELFGLGGARSESVREAIRQAVAGDWSPYSEHLRSVAGSNRARGVPLARWSDVVSAVESRLLGPTVAAYRLDGDRLTAALAAKRRFFYQTLRLLAETLLRSRESVIEEQQIAGDAAAQELVRSEARYRQLFEKSPLPTWVVDHASQRFLEVNDAAIAHYGYSRAEFLAMTVADIRPPESDAEIRERDGGS